MASIDDPSMSPGTSPGDGVAAPDANAAGDALRAAREAAGWSVDAVAQQLKLAPRQVVALENGDYAELPGRTFVRGFARNYARLLQLDADAVVAALPDASAAPALERPTLGSRARPIGAFEERPRRGIARVAIPVLLLALIGLGAWYELDRNGGLPWPFPGGASDKPTSADPVMPPALPGGTTPLPNPLTGADPRTSAADAPSLPPRDATPATQAADAGSAAAPSVPIGGTSMPAVAATPVPAPSASSAPGAAGEQVTLVISYRAPSWTEVRDAAGQRLLVGTMSTGSTQTITGTPPFEVTLGNVAQTTVTWRGATVDTSAYHRQNVARLQLN